MHEFFCSPSARGSARLLKAWQRNSNQPCSDYFRTVTLIADESIGEYGVLSLWESKEDAQAAEITLAPAFLLALKGHLKRMLMRRVLQVMQPKTA